MADNSPTLTVPVGKCRCPGTPHGDGDSVSIDRELGTAAGIAAATVLASEEGMTYPQKIGLMLEQVLPLAIRSWTLQHVNGTGKNEPLPVTAENVLAQLTWDKGGAEVALAAWRQYAATLGIPFAEKATNSQTDSASTPTGLTEDSSTSPTPATKRKRPLRSA